LDKLLIKKFKLVILLMVGLLALGGCQALSGSPEATAGVTRITLWQGVNPPPNRDVLQALVDDLIENIRHTSRITICRASGTTIA
jgi:multiple sugar transport system substrate-binding protein